MISRSAWLPLCLALLMPLCTAAGQSVPRVNAGEWVRISTKFEGADPDWLLAQIAELTPAYLVVDRVGAGRLAIPRELLTQLQVARGWASKKRQGTLIGATAGLAVSIVASLVADCSVYCFAGVAVGAGAGWRIGSAASGFAWSPIPVDQLDAAFRRARIARILAGAALRFRASPISR